MTFFKKHIVYSDVTSAYQWYAYRRAGMLIGNTELSDPDNKHLAYAKSFLKCENVKVYYGDWAAYHYCQFTNSDWHNGLKPGSVVKCTDGYYKQEGTNYYVTMTYKWVAYYY